MVHIRMIPPTINILHTFHVPSDTSKIPPLQILRWVSMAVLYSKTVRYVLISFEHTVQYYNVVFKKFLPCIFTQWAAIYMKIHSRKHNRTFTFLQNKEDLVFYAAGLLKISCVLNIADSSIARQHASLAVL